MAEVIVAAGGSVAAGDHFAVNFGGHADMLTNGQPEAVILVG